MGRYGGASLLLGMIFLSAASLGNPVGSSTNETEGDYFEDALEKWLGNFGTYTFMVEQDVDDSEDDGKDGGELVPEEPSVFIDKEEEEDEDYDQGSSAPITLTVKWGNGLLNPSIDYKVILESLVAEEGSVLVTLGSFGNKTTCGVGGFSLPSEAEGRDVPEGRLNISHQQYGNRSTTIVAFGIDAEEDTRDENSTTWTLGDEGSSQWEDQSRNLWWAMGRLAGGEQLTLIFTPPVCGCLTLKAYYALPLGENLTLVVGPEAYPSDLEKLICVDPSLNSIQENLIEEELEGDDSGHDAARGFTLLRGDEEEGEREVEEKDEEGDVDLSGSPKKVGRGGDGRWAARRRAKIQRKKSRQEARQSIRRAGRKVTRRKVRRRMRLQRRNDTAEEQVEERKVAGEDGVQDGVQDGLQDGSHGGKWARKQARKAARKKARKERTWKGKKPWRKHRKHRRRNGRRNKHNKHGRRRSRFHPFRNTTEGATETPLEEEEEEEEEGHHPEGGDMEREHHLNNGTELQTDEDALIDILLAEEGEEEVGEGEGEEEEGELEAEGDPLAGVTPSSPVSRRGRKHRRQKGRKTAKKWRIKTGKGGKFCCKQGIKYKKSKLPLHNNTLDEDYQLADDAEIPCNEVNDIVLTYAIHQFSVDRHHCSNRFETCCSKFTLQLWENLKAKRAAKKTKRKQQRKAARQERRRKNRRRQRRSSIAPPPPSHGASTAVAAAAAAAP